MYDSVSVLNAFLRTVDQLAAGGGKVTDEFASIRSRYDQVTTVSESAAVNKLSDFVLEGSKKKLDDSQIEALVCFAQSEVATNLEARAEVKQRIAGQVLATLRSDYKENSAEDNLRLLGSTLFAEAEKLADAIRQCDPDLHVEKVVMLEDNDSRTAWNVAPRLNSLVEEALKSLAAAAELAGIQPTKDNLFHLVVDARHLERKRPAFTVWDGATGRAGRFADLLKLRAHIAPVESVEEFKVRAAEQGRPGPLETRYVSASDSGFRNSVREITVDPDDPDYLEQVAASGAALGGLL